MAGNANFMTWNANKKYENTGITFKQGNTYVQTTTGYPVILSNMAPRTGKWYVEFYQNQSANYNTMGLEQVGSEKYSSHIQSGDNHYLYYGHNGNTRGNNGTSTSYGSSYSTGTIIGCALDMDNAKIYWSKDGTFQNSGNPATGTNAAHTGINTNFGYYMAFTDYNSGANGACTINAGQDSSFAGAKSTGSANASDANGFGDFYYTPPSGFLAVCSANMPTKEEIDPSVTNNNYPGKQFAVALYSGTSGTQTIDIGFKPDLVWWKNRGSGNSHILADSSRGADKSLTVNSNGAEGTGYQTYFTAFASTGPTFASNDVGTNQTGSNYAALCWRANGGVTSTNTDGTITSTVQANTDSGFSIVTYTGSGSAATIGHGLGKAPEWIIVKNRDQADDWVVYHIFNGNTHYMTLNSGAGKIDNTYWNDTTPTTSVFSVGTDHKVNASTEKYVAYCWAGVEGFSSFGGWTTASDDVKGPFIHCGFRPKMIIIKMTVNGDRWGWLDSERNTYNPRNTAIIFGDTSSAESTTTSYDVDFLSTGFQVTTSNAQHNNTGYDPYIYMAFADVPAKFSQGG
jgi:hypothetical protein